MDRIGADFPGTIQQMRDKLGAFPLLLQLPLGEEANFHGVIDLIANHAIVWHENTLGSTYSSEPIPNEKKEEAAHYRELILEKVAENDEILLGKYLGGEEISSEEIRQGIRKLTLSLKVIPLPCAEPP